MSFKRRVLLATLAILLVVGLGALVWPREQQPTYEGRTLSEWLSDYRSGQTLDASDSDQRDAEKAAQAMRAMKAVRAMGTNAVPILLRWISYSRPTWRQRLIATYYERWARKRRLDYTPPALIFGRGEIHADLAVDGFAILGGEARQAVPELARLTQAGNSRAALALLWIAPEVMAPTNTHGVEVEAARNSHQPINNK
jgi:hypothetical protein